ncbi:60S ribosomal protein L3 [Blastomyces dermatitidis ATCC 18188]|uniref:Large ribosomal subunit protein mL44 n=2 Tax=Ajellomyces dermatitidis TaxID=5039 RepID=F2TT18_AJEDA|nr:60S ribosomal protein L3 [Blastomyces dermatitidis ATCC 18188]
MEEQKCASDKRSLVCEVASHMTSTQPAPAREFFEAFKVIKKNEQASSACIRFIQLRHLQHSRKTEILRRSGSPNEETAAPPMERFSSFTADTAHHKQSSAFPSVLAEENEPNDDEHSSSFHINRTPTPPSPPVEASLNSAKLSAIHARLSLPQRLPLQTLARTLVDESADPTPQFNNKSLSILGGDLLTYYTSEYLISTYPRLPVKVLWAAMYSYIGAKPLAAMTREWGLEFAAEPGPEVDPGLLQFKRLPPDTVVETNSNGTFLRRDGGVSKRSTSARIIYGDAFGESALPYPVHHEGVTPNRACANFVRAIVGAVYLHAGRPAAKQFYKEHFTSRHLDMASLFSFRQPTRDLSKLCRREGFEDPVAKILSETGRLSNRPVFNVGIFSGPDKLGEGAGGSLSEARFRAAASALKGWYLYSPLGVRVPSSMEEEGAEPWKAVYVDPGEVIV